MNDLVELEAMKVAAEWAASLTAEYFKGLVAAGLEKEMASYLTVQVQGVFVGVAYEEIARVKGIKM